VTATAGRIVVFGGASWNTIIHVDAFPPPAPATLRALNWHETVGSSGAGKALNLAQLGVAVTLHTVIGDDEPGGRVRNALTAGGADFVALPDPRGTSRHINIMDTGGQRISLLAPLNGDAALDLDEVEPLIAGADVVLLEIVDHARRLIPLTRRHRKPVWTDLHSYDGARAYERDFIEAADVVFLSGDQIGDPRPFMERTVAGGARLVVCTLAEAGAIALAGDRWHEVPSEPAPAVVDTNGAGDAFAAGVLFGELRGVHLPIALRMGARAAALAVGSPDLASSELSADRLLQLINTTRPEQGAGR
jgi:acarbose 7IV-phosphotransferase